MPEVVEVQAKLAQAEQQEKADDLAVMKDLQRKHRFTARELGNLFRPRKR